MRVSISASGSPGSSSRDPVITYVAKSIIHRQQDQLAFSKLEIYSSLPLLFDIGRLIGERLSPRIQGVCVLASSGMAVGVAAALVGRLPITFFHRVGWPKPEALGLGPRFMPMAGSPRRLALVDSHEKTRYTSAVCYRELVDHNIQAVQVAVPVSFDAWIEPAWTVKHMDYCALLRFSEAVGAVSDALDPPMSADELAALMVARDSGFWEYPPVENPPNPYYEFDAPGIRERPGWFLGWPRRAVSPRTVSDSTRGLCEALDHSDEGVWGFFLEPGRVGEIAQAAGEFLHLEEFDCLVGVGHLGTAFATALAYFNRKTYRGAILSYLGRQGLLPAPGSLAGCRILPVGMRIAESGAYAVDLFLRVRSLGGQINHFLTVFGPSKTRDLGLQSHRASLGRLARLGVEFLSLT